MEPMQERLLSNYRSQLRSQPNNESSKMLIESYLRPALKQFGIEEVRDFLREYVMSTAKDKSICSTIIHPSSDAGEEMSETYSDIDYEDSIKNRIHADDEISKSEPMKVINNNPNPSNSSLPLQVTVSTEPLQQSSLQCTTSANSSSDIMDVVGVEANIIDQPSSTAESVSLLIDSRNCKVEPPQPEISDSSSDIMDDILKHHNAYDDVCVDANIVERPSTERTFSEQLLHSSNNNSNKNTLVDSHIFQVALVETSNIRDAMDANSNQKLSTPQKDGLKIEPDEESFDIPETTNFESLISLKSKTTTSSSDDFSGYSEIDKPKYNEHNQRVRGPFGVETKKTIPNLPIEFDEPISWDQPLRHLMDSMVPCMVHVNNVIARPIFKVFKTPLEIASDDFPTSLHLDRTHINITAPKLNAAIICVVNMFVYAIRELFFSHPIKGTMVHKKFFDCLPSWTTKGRTIETFQLDANLMWASPIFRGHFCPINCERISFHEVIQKSFSKYYAFLNEGKVFSQSIYCNFIPRIRLPTECNMLQFQESIQKAFNNFKGQQLDENIMFVSFESLPVTSSPIPYTIRLLYQGKYVVYQTASLYYQNSVDDCLTTICAKSSNAEWYRFNWEKGNNVQAKYTQPLTEKNLPRCHVTYDTKLEYHLEGILFLRIWDQMSSYSSDFSDTLLPATMSRLDGTKNSNVTSEDLKLIRVPTAWLNDTIISNVLVRMHAYYNCPCIFVEEVSLALHDSSIMHACKKKREDMDEFVMSNAFDNLSVWEITYGRLDENLKISRSLEVFFEPSKSNFLFFPVNVHGNHWILLVLSTVQKRIFIIDSMDQNGTIKDAYLVAIFIKYLEYKSSISNGAFIFVSADWRIESLPATKQQDGYNCGIHLIINAAMLMRQIKDNESVQISFVEDPMPVYEKKSQVLKEKVNKVRTTLYKTFLYRDSFENVMSSIFAVDSVPNPATPKKAKVTKKVRSKVVFLG
jgi:hypothetical protein